MSKVASAKTRGRLTKKELKQDKLVEYAYKVEHFYLANQKLVIGLAIAVVVVIAGIIGARKMIESSRLEQSYELMMAKMSYGAGRLDEAHEAFQKVLSTTGGGTAAEAKYFLGRVAFEQGDVSQAETQFKEYLDKFSGNAELDCAVHSGLAACLETQNKFEEAAQTYEKIWELFPENPFAPQALLEASRLYMKINQNDKALELAQLVADKFPDSSLRLAARARIDMLK
ncbi:MAG: tetratricopeptide repeat protein [bacterium]|nr:tetratricopeptide repeat protein [bacterium]